MTLDRIGKMAAQSAIGIALLASLVAVLLLAGMMGVLLIPYNVARAVAWIFGNLLNSMAFLIASIEERI